MVPLLKKQIKEFCSAASNPFSYNIFKNIYIWFGTLWGMPIPLVTISIHIHFIEKAGGHQPFMTALNSPLQWFLIAHPFLFGVLFGILGTIRTTKDNQIDEMITKLKDISAHDPLTGLKNRRFFAHNFYDECARSLRRNEALTLLFLDIDHFKKVNDKHGHHIGDVVLKELAAYIKSTCRPYDTPVRWGGEEFIILLRGSNEQEALLSAERIRIGIESGVPLSISFPITISIGLAEYRDDDTLESLVERADKALYHAKQTGRNKVVTWSIYQKENSL